MCITRQQNLKIRDAKTGRTEGEREIPIIVGNFNFPFSVSDRTTRQKIIKDIGNLNNIINQHDLMT